MSRAQILPESEPVPARLRAHAYRMIEDTATAHNGYGYSTEAWEREDLLQVLDQAADALERRTAQGAAWAKEIDQLKDENRQLKIQIETLLAQRPAASKRIGQ